MEIEASNSKFMCTCSNIKYAKECARGGKIEN